MILLCIITVLDINNCPCKTLNTGARIVIILYIIHHDRTIYRAILCKICVIKSRRLYGLSEKTRCPSLPVVVVNYTRMSGSFFGRNVTSNFRRPQFKANIVRFRVKAKCWTFSHIPETPKQLDAHWNELSHIFFRPILSFQLIFEKPDLKSNELGKSFWRDASRHVNYDITILRIVDFYRILIFLTTVCGEVTRTAFDVKTYSIWVSRRSLHKFEERFPYIQRK